MSAAVTLRASLECSLRENLSSTLLLRERVGPATVSTGLRQLDALIGGLPRGALTEIIGPASSGRSGVMFSALAQATQRQEACALVDASDTFDPSSAAAAGVQLESLLWIRCSSAAAQSHLSRQRAGLGRLEQVLKVSDLLLQGGGFGMVVLDLGNLPVAAVRRVPLTSWFRFRRAVEHTATVLLLLEQDASAKTCASLVVALERRAMCSTDAAQSRASRPQASVPVQNVVSHAALLRGMEIRAEVVRSWMQRKPVQAEGAEFKARVSVKGT